MSTLNHSGKDSKMNFKMKVSYLMLNRYTLTLFNLLLVGLLSLGVWDLGKSLLGNMKEVDDMSKVMCGTGSTIVSYGIVLEERKSLMSIFQCYPALKSKKETMVDSICSDDGIVLMVIGLFIEVTQQLIEIPNDVVNTKGKESIIFAVGFCLLIITIFHLIRFCYHLIQLKGATTENTGNSN